MGGAAPILLRFVVVCRPQAWSVLRYCVLMRVRPPVATPAGAGAGGRGGARRAGSAASPPGRRGPFGGMGDVPSASGGLEGRRPRGPQAGGGSRRGRGGGAAPRFPTPLPWGAGPWPPSQSPFFPSAPLLGIYVQPGLPGSPERRAGLDDRRWVSLAGEGGGEVSLPQSAPPSSPGGQQGGPLRLRPALHVAFPGCRRSVVAHGAGAEPPVGSGHCGSEWAADWARLARGCARRGCGVPPPGCRGPLGGVRGRRLYCRPLAAHRAGGGGGGGEGWEGGQVPRSPPLVPWRRPQTAAGRRPGGSGPGEPAAERGGALFPCPPRPFGCQTLVEALARAPCSPRCRRAGPAGRGGGRADECWKRRFGSPVSG